jgi:hypothetical protein
MRRSSGDERPPWVARQRPRRLCGGGVTRALTPRLGPARRPERTTAALGRPPRRPFPAPSIRAGVLAAERVPVLPSIPSSGPGRSDGSGGRGRLLLPLTGGPMLPRVLRLGLAGARRPGPDRRLACGAPFGPMVARGAMVSPRWPQRVRSPTVRPMDQTFLPRTYGTDRRPSSPPLDWAAQIRPNADLIRASRTHRSWHTHPRPGPVPHVRPRQIGTTAGRADGQSWRRVGSDGIDPRGGQRRLGHGGQRPGGT